MSSGGADARRVLVLAENERLFLPNCLAQVAARHPLVAIIEVPSPPLSLTIRRAWAAFGPAVLASIVSAEATARIVDRLSPHRFYSLRKVARQFDIPYEKVSALHGPDCLDAIRRYAPDVVFAQVSQRVRPQLLDLAPFWNKHCSLLPGYAGVLPIFWMLLHSETELGVTVHVMDEEFDRGPILQQVGLASEGKTFFGAYHELYDQVAPLIERALRGDLITSSSRPASEPSYYGFPTVADRVAFKRAGRRFGRPFRLHAPVLRPGNVPLRESAAPRERSIRSRAG